MRLDGICVDVIAMGLVVARIFDAAKREALFPDGHFGFEAEGEAPFDVLNRLLDGDVWGRGDEEMEVVGHEDDGVELVAAFGAVVVEKLEEEVRVSVGLEEASALSGDGGDEEGSDFLRREVHEGEVRAGCGGRKDYVGVVVGVWRERMGSRRLKRAETRAMFEVALGGAKGPRLKPLLFWAFIPWPEGHGFYRRLAKRGLMHVFGESEDSARNERSFDLQPFVLVVVANV